jgi:hypothetical protein
MPREAVTLYILIVFLVGTTIEFRDSVPTTLDLCKKEGFRQVRDYQDGNIKAKFECEQVVVNTPAGNESASSIARH